MPDRDADNLPSLAEMALHDATRLLRLGLSEHHRPIDELLDRLLQKDGGKWLEVALKGGPTGSFGSPIAFVFEGKATLDQLIAIKQTSKSLLHAEPNLNGRLTALASYFFAVAAALLHHHTNISSRTRDELDSVLLELAAVCPPPWAAFLDKSSSTPSE